MKRLIALLCAVCICTVLCSCKKKDPVVFSSDLDAGESVYVDVLSIVPKHTITSGSSVSDVVCKCTTLSGDTVWVCMSTYQYEDLDPSASFSGYQGIFHSGAFYPKGLRIQGRSVSAENLVSGLAEITAPVIVRYSESAEDAIDPADQIPPIPYDGVAPSATPVYADIVSLTPSRTIASQNIYVRFLVCDCTTTAGETLPLYISVGDYNTNFDAEANFTIFDIFADTVELTESVRIYGLTAAPEDLAGDLSDEIPVDLFVFDSCESVPRE